LILDALVQQWALALSALDLLSATLRPISNPQTAAAANFTPTCERHVGTATTAEQIIVRQPWLHKNRAQR
jgi:hypothetical protein